MELIIKLILISGMSYWIFEASGFVVSLSKGIWKLLNKDKPWLGQLIPKPFSCPECMTMWITFFMLLWSDGLLLSLAIASANSYSVRIWRTLDYLITKLIFHIQDWARK